MKHLSTLTCVALAAVLLLALAVPAFADTSGTVYGKAILQPYSVTISGGGTDSNSPLTYEGSLGGWADEKFGSQVTIQNSGTEAADMTIVANELPNAPGSIWQYAMSAGADVAVWQFYDEPTNDLANVLLASDPEYSASCTLAHNVASGDSRSYTSYFSFPTSTYSSADHLMSATISVVAPQ